MPRVVSVFLLLLGSSLAYGAIFSHYRALFVWVVPLTLVVAGDMVWEVSRDDPAFLGKGVPVGMRSSALIGTFFAFVQFFGMFFGASAAGYFVTHWFGW